MHPVSTALAHSGLALVLTLCTMQGAPARVLGPFSQQETPELERGLEPDRATAPVRIGGRVLGPEGTPVSGVVVLTDQGGKALSARDGSFELEVRPAREAQALRVSAFASGASSQGGSLVASATLRVPLAGGALHAGDLLLTSGGPCEPGWLPTFGGHSGVLGVVRALAVFDDGNGPALYAGGTFGTANGVLVDGFARWDGAAWSKPAGGLDGTINSLLVFDDGSGPALHAGGTFHLPGSSNVRVARWDGSTWTPLGGLNAVVHALAAHDDGSGPALHAGGEFVSVGGVALNRIARWDGTSWSALGSGFADTVHALEVFDDGEGPALYAGGRFLVSGDLRTLMSRIAKWDGTSWSALGEGISGDVHSLAAYDGGTGAALVAGGQFQMAGGLDASRIARWDGTSWSALGAGLGGTVRALRAFDDGEGPALYAGGSADGIARWDGARWSPVGSGVNTNFSALALEPFDPGSGLQVIVGGQFYAIGGQMTGSIASWDGEEWSALGQGDLPSLFSATVLDDGSGPMLCVGGFPLAPPHASPVRWDGSEWTPIGGGFPGIVRVLLARGEPGSQVLYAGGSFSQAWGAPGNRLAVWDGESWSAVGGEGLNGIVRALVFHDDGNGEALFVGGDFSQAGGAPASRVAKWDGVGWRPLGSGMGPFGARVNDLCVYDDGNGPMLYATGSFDIAGGVQAKRIARWDGTHWHDVGGGLNHNGLSLAAFDSGDDGPSLFVGGLFHAAGGVPTGRIARWNGQTWFATGFALVSSSNIFDIQVFDDGSGPALYAVGASLSSVGNAAWRWEGGFFPTWSALDTQTVGPIHAITLHDDGQGPALYLAGGFGTSAAGDSMLAKYQLCPQPGEAFCFGAAGSCPCGNTGGEGQGCANSSGAGASIVASGSASLAADDLSIAAANLLPGQPALLFAGTEAVGGGVGLPFGDGLRCAGGDTVRLGVQVPDGAGAASFGPGLASQTGFGAGSSATFQVWYRDTQGSPCGQGFNLSHALTIAIRD